MRRASVALALVFFTGIALGQEALDVSRENETSIQEVATVTPVTRPVERGVVPT